RRGMATDAKDLETLVLVRVVRLNAAIAGVVTGLLAGFALFVATNWLVFKGGPVVGPHLALLGQYFIGYRVSFVGSLIGFAWAFVLGFVVGAAVVAIYNRLADLRDPPARGRRPGAPPRASSCWCSSSASSSASRASARIPITTSGTATSPTRAAGSPMPAPSACSARSARWAPRCTCSSPPCSRRAPSW